jgi:esterase/lipase superfamily enzyme
LAESASRTIAAFDGKGERGRGMTTSREEIVEELRAVLAVSLGRELTGDIESLDLRRDLGFSVESVKALQGPLSEISTGHGGVQVLKKSLSAAGVVRDLVDHLMERLDHGAAPAMTVPRAPSGPSGALGGGFGLDSMKGLGGALGPTHSESPQQRDVVFQDSRADEVPDPPGVLVPLFFGTDRAPAGERGGMVQFGGNRGELTLGTCQVSIPMDHRWAYLEEAGWKTLWVEFPGKHVMLRSAGIVAADAWESRVRSALGASEGRSLLVFVHGFKTSFPEAARRAAQIMFDLAFDREGVGAFYSWPTKGGVRHYDADKETLERSVLYFREFIRSAVERTEPRQVHIIAHSMGARLVARAMEGWKARGGAGGAPRFNEVVLAAPDIDAEVFERVLYPAMRPHLDRLTLYASSNDLALAASKKLHQIRRVGETRNGIVVLPGMDSVDASLVNTGFLGHSGYGDCEAVVSDIHDVVRGVPVARRPRLKPKTNQDGRYWWFPKSKRLRIGPFQLHR